MDSFDGKLAVITGGGTGMGRELAIALAASGCHVALCDVQAPPMEETARLCAEKNAAVKVSTHLCDVADEAQVLAFKDAALAAHASTMIHLLFNNAGIGGGGSFVKDSRADWERTFSICWQGVYLCTRAFLPSLIAADEARLVNTSSINGFWASLGPGTAHTAYSTAKFAVKGFSEALLTDLALNAPHVGVSVVMPGHIGTEIVNNTGRALGKAPVASLSSADLVPVRERLRARGLAVDELSDQALREELERRGNDFRDRAPTSAAQAAAIILEGVKSRRWRILVGDDAHAIDELVRESPAGAYDDAFIDQLHARGHLQGVLTPRR